MFAARLYLLLLGGVLLVGACGVDRSGSDTSSSDTALSSSAHADAAAADTATTAPIRVLVLGNSIAAGQGVPPDSSFPAHLQRMVDSLGWNVAVQNAGVSGETTAGGRRRISWLLDKPIDVLILELGGNDGLRGVDPSQTKANLSAIVDSTLSVYPAARVLLAGMQIPPNLGEEYTERFRKVYPNVADQYDRVRLIPFVMKGVAGTDSLMQDDGLHPTAAGQRRVAKNVWAYLHPLLEKIREGNPV